jgi:hypothetical protein
MKLEMFVALMVRIIFVALLFAPIAPIYAVEGVSSVVRLDLILSIFLVILLFANSGFRRSIFRGSRGLIAVAVLFVYLYTSLSLFAAFAQVLLYISLYCAYYLGSHAFQGDRRICIDEIYFLLAINCLIHAVYHYLQLDSFLITHTNGIGQIENDVIFGLFGISKMPFQFILYVGFFLFLTVVRRNKIGLSFYMAIILALYCAATSESRVGLFALLIGIFLTFRPAAAAAAAVALLVIAVIPFTLTEKMSFIFAMDYSKIADDPSIGMRLINIENFSSWFSLEKILMGGGAFANLQFTSTYGEPGALDMLYVRFLAEFGFPLTVIGATYFILNLWRKFIASGGLQRRVILGWLFFIFVYSLLNEGVIASRSGHLVFFALGLFLSNQVVRNYTCNLRAQDQLNPSRTSCVNRTFG